MRKIYITYAYVVDANGTFNDLTGYPKRRDSSTSDMAGDIDKTLARANADNADAWSAINKADNRKVQTVFTVDETGFVVIPAKSRGDINAEAAAE